MSVKSPEKSWPWGKLSVTPLWQWTHGLFWRGTHKSERLSARGYQIYETNIQELSIQLQRQTSPLSYLSRKNHSLEHPLWFDVCWPSWERNRSSMVENVSLSWDPGTTAARIVWGSGLWPQLTSLCKHVAVWGLDPCRLKQLIQWIHIIKSFHTDSDQSVTWPATIAPWQVALHVNTLQCLRRYRPLMALATAQGALEYLESSTALGRLGDLVTFNANQSTSRKIRIMYITNQTNQLPEKSVYHNYHNQELLITLLH